MTLIQCKVGYAETQVGAETYVFNRDEHGRYVANVFDLRHEAVLLSLVDVYVRAAEVVAEPAAAPAPAVDPAIALKADIENATLPQVAQYRLGDEKRWFVQADWPLLTALPLADIEAGLPPFAMIDPSDRLLLNTENGKATYILKGVVDATRVYALADGSTIDLTTIPQDGGDQQQQTPTTPKPKGLIDINGVGPKMLEKLTAAGVATLDALVALTVEELAALDTTIGAKGAIARDGWVQQARVLLEG